MNEPLVAVIIPCFNASKWIEYTLKSVFLQTYKNIEIIVIDDGSTDNSKEIVRGLSNDIKILTHVNCVNKGQASSLNLGIQNTQANYIAFLDSDDIWYPEKVKQQVEMFMKNVNIDLIYTNGYVVDESGDTVHELFDKMFIEDNKSESLLLDCYIRTPSSVMVKRRIFNKAGLFKEYLHSLDHDMWIRISEMGSLLFLNEYLTGYRIHSGQKSSSRRQWEDGFLILNESCKRYGYGFNVKRKRLAVIYYRLGVFDLNSSSILKGVAFLVLAGVLDPIRAARVLFCNVQSFLNSPKGPIL